MEQDKDTKRNCMTHLQGHKLINYIEALAENGKIRMTAQKIAESSGQAVGMVPAKQSVTKLCKSLGIEFENESRAPNGKGGVKHRISTLEAQNGFQASAIKSLAGRVTALEDVVKTLRPPLAPLAPFPTANKG